MSIDDESSSLEEVVAALSTEEEARHKLLLNSANQPVVRQLSHAQTFRVLPGLASAQQSSPRAETRVAPPWATELMSKLDKIPIADLDTELAAAGIVWLKTSSTVGDALFFLRKYGVTGAPVFKNDDCWGMIELSDIMTILVRAPRPSFARLFRGDSDPDSPINMRLENVIDFADKPSAFLINSSFYADSLVEAFRDQWRVGLYSKGDLKSIVSQTALLQIIAKNGVLGKICSKTSVLAAGLIVSPVYACTTDDSTGLVMAAMSAQKINSVAVTQQGQFFSALSSHVLLDVENLEDLSLPVGRLLAKFPPSNKEPVLTCGPKDSVADLVKKFATGRGHRIFVVERKVAIGVITLSSLFRCMYDARAVHQAANMGAVNILH